MVKKLILVLALTLAPFLAGCQQYYRVTDPTSGNVYYTRNDLAFRYGWNGSVQFKELGTGATVTLPASEIVSVPKDEAEIAVARRYSR